MSPNGGSLVQVETSLEAAVLGWLATREENAGGERVGQPLVEVVAADLGLEPNPATLDALAATLAGLERQERILLDGPVLSARDLAPLELTAPAGAPPAPPGPAPRVETYSQLAQAPRHVQLNWALRALRDRTDESGEGEFDFRAAVTDLGLNPKDVRHALESLGLLRRAGSGPAESWWVDPSGWVSAPELAELDRPPAPPTPEQPPEPGPAGELPASLLAAAKPLAELGPVVESLNRLEPRLVDLIHEMVDAAESLREMAANQAHLLREQTAEIESLRQDRERMLRDAAGLRQEIWTLKRASARSPQAEELTAEAGKVRAAERRFAGTASEVADKVRRVNRGLDEVGEQMGALDSGRDGGMDTGPDTGTGDGTDEPR